MAPTFVPAALGDGTSGTDTVIVGQKNGNLYSFNAITGDVQWNIVTSPDSSTAGALSWGLAVDDSQIYFTAINFGAHQWTLQPSGPSINNSAYGAANLKTGKLIWETQTPDNQLAYTPPGVVNDLVFVGKSGGSKTPQPGAVLALSKKTGVVLQTWPVDSVQRGGIMIHDGFVIFGTGYHYSNPYNNGSFYVMGLPNAIKQAKDLAAATASSSIPKSTGTIGSPNGGEGGPAKKGTASRMMGETSVVIALYPMAFLVLLVFSLG
jgi:outer membrane protein assembly factor BamB